MSRSREARRCARRSCTNTLTGRSERTRFCSARCRQADYRTRLTAAAEAAGVPARLSLQKLQASTGTGQRHGDAQNGRRAAQTRKREGVSIYLKRPELAGLAIDTLDAVIDALRRTHDPAVDELQEIVDAARRAQARHRQRPKR